MEAKEYIWTRREVVLRGEEGRRSEGRLERSDSSSIILRNCVLLPYTA